MADLKAEYRSDLPPRPPRIAALPLDYRGYPIPWFVAWFRKGERTPCKKGDGAPDFRVAEGLELAVTCKLCWVCGGELGSFKTFVIGPMCAINRTNAEPPSHHECATYTAMACPFLTQPARPRREKANPLDNPGAPGVMILRNPGVVALWTVKKYQLHSVRGVTGARDGILFHFDDPVRPVEWFAEGRTATRPEILASIDSGYPLLLDMATKEGGIAELEGQRAKALSLLPA